MSYGPQKGHNLGCWVSHAQCPECTDMTRYITRERQVAPTSAAAAQELCRLSTVWSTVACPIKQGWQSSRTVIWPSWMSQLWRILYPSQNRSRTLRAPSQANQLRSRAFHVVPELKSWWVLVLRPFLSTWVLRYSALRASSATWQSPYPRTLLPHSSKNDSHTHASDPSRESQRPLE